MQGLARVATTDGGDAVWLLRAHKKAVTELSFNKGEDAGAGILATGSLDKKVKIWRQEAAEDKVLGGSGANDISDELVSD